MARYIGCVRMGSARRNDKARGKEKDRRAKSACPAPLIPKVYGCPVPEPIHCFSGESIPLGGDGVRMECSNEKCPFENVLLHQECFEALEDHLVKILSNLGSARGWTDAQRRANLWDKKGQALIAKLCRCRCGFGLTRMDELAAYNRLKRKAHEEEEARREAAMADGRPTPTLKKKHRTKNYLPKLNFGSTKFSHSVVVDEREPRPMARQCSAKLRDLSSSSISSNLGSQAFESRRESLIFASDAWNLVSNLRSGDKTRYVMPGHAAEQDDTISTSSKNDFSPDSYNMLGSDCGIEQKTGSTISSDFLERPSFEYLGSPVKEDVVTVSSLTSSPFRRTQDLPLSGSFIVPECATPNDNARNWAIISNVQAISVPVWHLFEGTSFALGESILANLFLPSRS